LGDTSDVGVVKSSLHFRILRNGKTIPLVSDSNPDRPRTNDSLQTASENEVDFSILSKDKSLPSCIWQVVSGGYSECHLRYMEMDCIIRLPVSRFVSCSVENFLQKVTGTKFCNSCQKDSLFSEVRKFSSCSSHIIFQLLRFSEVNGGFIKNSDHVVCDSI